MSPVCATTSTPHARHPSDCLSPTPLVPHSPPQGHRSVTPWCPQRPMQSLHTVGTQHIFGGLMRAQPQPFSSAETSLSFVFTSVLLANHTPRQCDIKPVSCHSHREVVTSTQEEGCTLLPSRNNIPVIWAKVELPLPQEHPQPERLWRGLAEEPHRGAKVSRALDIKGTPVGTRQPELGDEVLQPAPVTGAG